ncbi:glycosyltransferase domain-containing protein [Runella limosa]|uniref:glycosyltransferase domain-containing protein n=1 Tax=Runella limosa TaxID=370978 RepID=UPI0004904139|nr:glycosyltransferase domain-containing protein [Runella limosa]
MWTNYKQKDYLLYNFLLSRPRNEIVLFCDGYDSVILGNENDILKKYESFNRNIVFSGEINCHPDITLKDLYPSKKGEYNFLNSGGFISKSKYLLEIYDFYFSGDGKDKISNEIYSWSNQYFWTNVYLNKMFDIEIDHNSEIFQTFSSEINQLNKIIGLKNILPYKEWEQIALNEVNNILGIFEIRGKKIYNMKTKTYPCHFHFNSLLLKHVFFSQSFKRWLPWL